MVLDVEAASLRGPLGEELLTAPGTLPTRQGDEGTEG